jgi:hypothetical protein
MSEEKKKEKRKAKKDRNSGISLFRRVFHEVVSIESNALESLAASGTTV